MADTASGICIFCEIVAGRAPAERIGENERALAILDIQPFSDGHTLIVSKRHVAWWHDLTREEAADVFSLAHEVAGRLRKAFEPEFVCLYARGRRIPHTHVFLVPTSSGDTLDHFFNDLEKIQETSAELAPLRTRAVLENAALRARKAPK